MPRRPAPRSSQLRPLAREARPSSGYYPSLAGGITRVLWQSQDNPEGEPLFALEDTAEGGH